MQQADSLCGLLQFQLSHPAGAVCLLQQAPQLLHLRSQESVPTLRQPPLLPQLPVLVQAVRQLQLQVLEVVAVRHTWSVCPDAVVWPWISRPGRQRGRVTDLGLSL